MRFPIFHDFSRFCFTWDPMGANTSKCYSSIKWLFKIFQTSPEFSSNGPHKSTIFGFLKFCKFNFSIFIIIKYGTVWQWQCRFKNLFPEISCSTFVPYRESKRLEWKIWGQVFNSMTVTRTIVQVQSGVIRYISHIFDNHVSRKRLVVGQNG